MKASVRRLSVFVLLSLLGLGMYLSLDRRVSADPAPVACSDLTFSPAPGSPFSTTTTNSQGLAVGDLNNDGNPDIVTANTGGVGPSEGNVSVLLSDGAGGYTQPSGSPLSVGGNGYVDAVVIADLNSDGKKDIAVAAAAFSDRVLVFLGDGLGGFSQSSNSPFPVGLIPAAIVVGNFNGDSIPDLATANRDSNDVSILIGVGGGNFTQPGSPIGVAPGPLSLSVGNLDGDADQDIVVGSHLGSGAVSVLLGDGSGGFTSSQFDPGYGPVTSARVGDFNGDGKLDIAAAHPGSNKLSLMQGDGTGSFTQFPGSPISTGLYGYSIDVGDLNGDGSLDAIAGNLLPPGGIAVFLGNGSGGLTAAPGSPIFAGLQPNYVAIADINADGRQDIATSNGSSFNLSVFLNTCTALVPPTLGNYPDVTVRAGDFVRSIPDAAPTNATSFTMTATPGFNGTIAFNSFNGRARIWNANPAGTYTITVTAHGYGSVSKTFQVTVTDPIGCGDITFSQYNRSVAPNSGPFSPAIGDFDLDGFSDVAVVDIDSDSVTILLADENYPQPAPVPVGSAPRAIVVGDFNGDGIFDFVTANNGDGTLSLMLGNGDEDITFSESPLSPFDPPGNIFELAKGDFNGDGRDDLAASNFNAGKVTILLSTDAGGFDVQPASPFSVGTGPLKLAVGDFNEDGKADIATANTQTNNISIVLGNGDGTFGTPSLVTVGNGPRGIAVGDFDADGDQDIATGNLNSNDVTVLLGDGSGGFAEAPGSPYAAGLAPQAVTVADFNGDGAQDLAITNRDSHDVTILKGNGTGGFSAFPGSPFAVGIDPRDAVMLDFDRDGREDLAVANQTSGDVTFLRNECTAGNTPTGTSVPVTVTDTTTGTTPVSLVFDAVTAAGNTTLTTSATGPAIPAGFVLGSPAVYYDIGTTAAYSGSIGVCIDFSNVSFPSGSTLRLLHYESGAWADVTTSGPNGSIICGSVSSLSPFVVVRKLPTLSSLGPANVWVGLKNSDDVGIRFDLRAEVYRGVTLVGSGEAAGFVGGSSGFNNAKLDAVAMTPLPGVTFSPGDQLSIKLLVRNACTGSGKNSGTARLWFNDSAANSRFNATIGTPATYYLRASSILATSVGAGPKASIDVAAGAKCSAYKPFGTWNITLP